MSRGIAAEGLLGKLTIWLALTGLTAILIEVWLSYAGAQRQAEALSNQRLTQMAHLVAAGVAYDRATFSVSLHPKVVVRMAAEDQVQIIYSVFDPDGRLIAGRSDFEPPADTPKFRSRFFGTVFHGTRLRSMTLRHPIAVSGGTRYVAVLVAEPAVAYQQSLLHTWPRLFAKQAALLLATLFMVWMGMRRQVRPISALRHALSDRQNVPFEPIDVSNVLLELRPLVIAYNRDMKWLEQLRRQRRFLESAAHQLRTPLAIMKTQVGHVRRTGTQKEVSDTLSEIDQSLTALGRLTTQLLMLGKVEHEQATQQLERVDLVEIVRAAVAEAIPKGLDHGVELVFDPGGECRVFTDALLMRELVRNLVDNAVSHAGEGAIAVVSVRSSATEAVLKVDDDGVGVDEADRVRLSGRFTRVGKNSREGSGLGLSIVAEIAEIYGGTLELPRPRRGHGFCAIVRFPLACVEELAEGTGRVLDIGGD